MASKSCSYVLNIVYAIFGLCIFSIALWLYIEVTNLTNLRNSNHYLLDYNLYWPQVIPWLFIIVGVLIISVSCCGVFGAKKASKGLVFTHVIFIAISIFAIIAVAIVSFVFGGSTSTDKFLKDTIWDAYFQSKTDTATADAFGLLEKRFQCCGAMSPRDYVNWKTDFPQSCCDVYYHGWLEPYTVECDITNKRANERHGCSEVAAQYARIAMYGLSGASIVAALIGLGVLINATVLLKSLRRKPKNVTAKYESESKKVLL
ncbi:hypothetical protein ACJJTC_000263 [Scirpophaga incertulas]